MDDVPVRTQIDGLSVSWSPAPIPVRGPVHAALAFRHGRADETLATSGRGHMVEHLALHPLDFDHTRFGGYIDHTRTVFHGSGTEQEVRHFLRSVSETLQQLPVDRMGVEKEVLITESASTARTPWHAAMGLRFGANGYGLVGFEELGLRRLFPGLDEDELIEWAQARYTRDNAALWVAGLDSPEFDLPLPRGERIACPEPVQAEGLVTPACASHGGGGVMISLLGRRSTPLSAAVQLLGQSVHQRLRMRAGVTYVASGTYTPLDGTWAHLALAADCLPENESRVQDELLEELMEFASHGPTPHDLERMVSERLRDIEDPLFVLTELDVDVHDELAGVPRMSRAEYVEKLRGLTPESVATAAEEVLGSALMLASSGSLIPNGFNAWSVGGAREPVRGKRYRRRVASVGLLGRRESLVVSPDGVSSRTGRRRPTATIHFADTVALLERGLGRVSLIGKGGESMDVLLPAYRRGTALGERVRRSVPEEIIIPLERPEAEVLEQAWVLFGLRSVIEEKDGQSPAMLRPGERTFVFASVERLRENGLLVLTDRRLMYVSSGFLERGLKVREFPLGDITRVRCWRVMRRWGRFSFVSGGRRRRFAGVSPRENVDVFVGVLRSITRS